MKIIYIFIRIYRKKSKSFKEQAEKQYEKKKKDYIKRQQKIEQSIESDFKTMPHRPSTVLTDLKQRLWSSSQGNLKQPQREQGQLNNGTKFSALVGGTISGQRGAVQRKVQKAKQNNMTAGGDFKIGEIESGGKRSVRSLQGVQRDSEVLYVGTFSSNADIGKRGKITDVFGVDESKSDAEEEADTIVPYAGGTLSRSFSQPDFLANEAGTPQEEVSEEVILQRPSGLFDRPMLGSLAFR